MVFLRGWQIQRFYCCRVDAVIQRKGLVASAWGLQWKQSTSIWASDHEKKEKWKKTKRKEKKKAKTREGQNETGGGGREGSPFGNASCHFPSWPLCLTSSSSIYNLFSVCSGRPGLTQTPQPNTSSLFFYRFSFGLKLFFFLYLSKSLFFSLLVSTYSVKSIYAVHNRKLH